MTLHPIHLLAPEILAHIFLECLADYDSSTISELTYQNPRFPYFVPFLLSQVCSSWRTIALSEPRLWAIIRMSISDMASSQTVESRQSLLRLFLRRSGEVPLFVHIKDHRAVLLPMVLEHSYRLIQAEFDTQALAIRCYFPRLRYLGLVLYEREPDSFGVQQQQESQLLDSWDQLLPNLTAVRVRPSHVFSHIFQQLSSQRFPWDRFTQLTLDSCGLSQCLDLLHRGKELTQCNLHMCHETHGFPTGLSHISSNLHSLTLKVLADIHPGFLSGLFLHLSIPDVVNLSISSAYRFSGLFWAQKDFLDMLDRSKCLLQTLSLDGIAMTDQDLLDCISRLPSLTTLHVAELHLCPFAQEYPLITNHVLDSLTTPKSFGRLELLPRLKHLKIEGTLDSFRERTLIKFLQTRMHPVMGPGCTLESLEMVTTKRVFSPSTLPLFKQFREAGLKFSLWAGEKKIF